MVTQAFACCWFDSGLCFWQTTKVLRPSSPSCLSDGCFTKRDDDYTTHRCCCWCNYNLGKHKAMRRYQQAKCSKTRARYSVKHIAFGEKQVYTQRLGQIHRQVVKAAFASQIYSLKQKVDAPLNGLRGHWWKPKHFALFWKVDTVEKMWRGESCN